MASSEQVGCSWLDISARVNNQTDPDMIFKQAVHLSLYWAQDYRQEPICRTAPIPRLLLEQARSAHPLTQEQVIDLGAGRWPLQAEQLDIGRLPRQVTENRTKKGSVVTWVLNESQLVLRKLTPEQNYAFVTELEILRDCRGISVRVMIGTLGRNAPVPRTIVAVKILASMYGLFDGNVQLLPSVRVVETPEDAEAFVLNLEDSERQRPMITAAMPKDGKSEALWKKQLSTCAKDSFGLQHVNGITNAGLEHVRELLGSHAPQAGCVKVYRPGFSQLELKQAHPVAGHHAIEDYESGFGSFLYKLTTRLAARDARVQREEHPIAWPKFNGSEWS